MDRDETPVWKIMDGVPAAMDADIQTCLSLFAFEPWTLGQQMKYIAGAGYICTVSAVQFSLMFSFSIRTSVKAVGISFLGAGKIAIASESAMTLFELAGIPLYFGAMMVIYRKHGH